LRRENVVAKKAGTEDGKAAQNINNVLQNPKSVLIGTSLKRQKPAKMLVLKLVIINLYFLMIFTDCFLPFVKITVPT